MRKGLLAVTVGGVGLAVYMWMLPNWPWIPGGYRGQLVLTCALLGAVSATFLRSGLFRPALLVVSPFLVFLGSTIGAYALNGVADAAPVWDAALVFVASAAGSGFARWIDKLRLDEYG